jgi:hypothetical protein
MQDRDIYLLKIPEVCDKAGWHFSPFPLAKSPTRKKKKDADDIAHPFRLSNITIQQQTLNLCSLLESCKHFLLLLLLFFSSSSLADE